jgi:putative pyruvate formate lyase activating enzyme
MADRIPELQNCRICPRNCAVNRYKSTGFCHAPAELKINLYQLHHGEEPVLSGTRGSGAIFFSHCNLQCVFCQNHTISSKGWGKAVSDDECINIMLELQDKGAHNINLVTPTHYSLQLAEILHKAKDKGLAIPVVWNSSAYEKVEILQRLEGLVDIYLPDLKYADRAMSALYSQAEDYPEVARAAILEMQKQVGHLECDVDGIASRGLLIRLLVMPNSVAGVTESLQWIIDYLGKGTRISLMAQYYPAGQADQIPAINRGITEQEYNEVVEIVEKLGFADGFIQELSCSADWTPDFKNSEG